MKKVSILFVFLTLFLLLSCADRTIYNPSTSSADNLRWYTGLVLFVELILGFILSWRMGAAIFGQNIGVCIGSGLFSYLLGFLIFAEWGFKLINWILSSMVGKIIWLILNLIGGIFSLFSGTVTSWVLNGYFWHSTDFYKWAIIPALIGGAIQLVLIAHAKKNLD